MVPLFTNPAPISCRRFIPVITIVSYCESCFSGIYYSWLKKNVFCITRLKYMTDFLKFNKVKHMNFVFLLLQKYHQNILILQKNQLHCQPQHYFGSQYAAHQGHLFVSRTTPSIVGTQLCLAMHEKKDDPNSLINLNAILH